MTATNPLGVHFIPKHTGRHHYDYITALRPWLAKLVGDSTPDVQLMSDMFVAAPNAIHIWRNHALSEQHDALWRDPAGTAQRHVAELHKDIQERYEQAKQRGLPMPTRHQIQITGINEPVVELFARQENMSNYDDWLRMMQARTPLLDIYMSDFAAAANTLGYGAELGNFSSGQPANLKPGDYPTFKWFPRTIKTLELTRGRNALSVHEYWRAETGPEGWWDWHTCRFFHLEVNCDIHVLECGVDQQITTAPANGTRGWLSHMTPAQYVAQTRTYIQRCMTDPRFCGATPFSLDGGDAWTSFYIEPCMAEFLGLARELEQSVKPQPKPVHDIFLPSVPNTTHTVTSAPVESVQPDNWPRAYPVVLKVEGGLSLDPNDKGNWYNGELVGTNHGISGAVWGGQYDIRNLTQVQAIEIYRQHYWLASGADKLPWPLCLVHFDTAVNAGVGRANILLGQSQNDPYLYLLRRKQWYESLAQYPLYGKAWSNRVYKLADIAAMS